MLFLNCAINLHEYMLKYDTRKLRIIMAERKEYASYFFIFIFVNSYLQNRQGVLVPTYMLYIQ